MVRVPPFRRRRRHRARFQDLALWAACLLFLGVFVASDGFRRWPPASDPAESATIPSPRTPFALTGRAQIIDGDTLEISGQRIRLWGVDAPEQDQTCQSGAPGAEAESALRRAAADGVVCTPRNTDAYGRVVAVCRAANGADLSAMLVSEGWAWDYARYSGGRYAQEERRASREERGVWALGCEPAWEWRQRA